MGVAFFFGGGAAAFFVVTFLTAVFGFTVLVTRPDLVLPRTTSGLASTAGVAFLLVLAFGLAAAFFGFAAALVLGAAAFFAPAAAFLGAAF